MERIIHGDCLEALRLIEDNSIDSIIKLWEQAVIDGDIEKAKSIRHELMKIMRRLEKENRKKFVKTGTAKLRYCGELKLPPLELD